MKNVMIVRGCVELALCAAGMVAAIVCTITMETMQDGDRVGCILFLSMLLGLMGVISLYQDFYTHVKCDEEGGCHVS